MFLDCWGLDAKVSSDPPALLKCSSLRPSGAVPWRTRWLFQPGISSKQANKGAFSPHSPAVDNGTHWIPPVDDKEMLLCTRQT